MEKKTFNVPAISCGHCVKTIENELSEIDGVANVKGDVETREVVVEWDNPATWTQIRSVLEEIEYPPAPQDA